MEQVYVLSSHIKYWTYSIIEPRHDKTNEVAVHPGKRLRSAWASVSLLSTWRKLRSLVTHWVHSEDSDQTGWKISLISVFAGRTLILLVLSCHGSIIENVLIEIIPDKITGRLFQVSLGS